MMSLVRTTAPQLSIKETELPGSTPESHPQRVDLRDLAALRSGLIPLYHSLGQVIRGRIQSGEWPVGGPIPSERSLMQMFGVSRATVRQSIDFLVKEGVLERIRGKGTFVAPPKVKQGVLRLREFFRTMQQYGLSPTAHLLGIDTLIPEAHVRQALLLPEGAPVVWLQRLLLVNAFPMIIETCYLPAARFPGLVTHYTASQDLEQYLNREYYVLITEEREMFEPVILEHAEAQLLGVEKGFPALWVEVVGRDEAGSPVVYRTSLLRGDRCRFYVDLTFNEQRESAAGMQRDSDRLPTS
jgi:GntR family transcriptional regulator